MTKDESKCPLCSAINSYSIATCTQCGEELPWASWVRAREAPSEAIGAGVGAFARGPKISDGLDFWSALPTGLTMKMLAVFAVMVGSYFVVGSASSTLRKSTTAISSSASTAGKQTGKTAGNVVEQFRESNPAVQQDKEDRHAEK